MGMVVKVLFWGLFFLNSNLELFAESTHNETSLAWLKRGNIRYVKSRFRNDGASQKDRDRLVSGQKPHSIILSCSDSRIPPEIIFDQKLGEIFVVRTAGEAIDSVAIASIEYAVEHLGTKLIVVLGHEECGAVKAAIKTLDGSSAGSPHLDKLVGDIHPRIKTMMAGKKSPSLMVADEAKENAKCIATDLQSRSSIVKEKVEGKELSIVPGIYHLKTGVVDFL
jgi:carbonic anhydrase